MDSDFLREYDAREREAFDQNKSGWERVGNLKLPLFQIVEPSSSIWSQAAFSGTLFVPLYPVSENVFEENYEIKTNEILDLVQFVRDTKKIQFVLTASPMEYEFLDYLDPIFQEFSPPLISRRPVDERKFQEFRDKCQGEIALLISVSSFWKKFIRHIGCRADMDGLVSKYTLLRYFGFDEIADTFIDNFLVDPKFAHDYIDTVYYLFAGHLIDPFNTNISISTEIIQRVNELGLNAQLSFNETSFPEVGSYLMQKCTHYPESLQACKNLVGEYEDQDLYRVFSALNTAVIEKNEISILTKTTEMGEILDNIWLDTKIKDDAMAYNWGINIGIGTIGFILGGTPGLVGTVMGKAIDSQKTKFIDTYSELIAKKITSPCMATIFDFKKKYQK